MSAFRLKVIALCAVFAIACNCSRLSVEYAGGAGGETTNGRISGVVRTVNGEPAPHTRIKLLSDTYDAFKDTVPAYIDTTDDAGGFDFTGLPNGSYNLQSKHLGTGFCALKSELTILRDSIVTVLAPQKPGAIKIMLSSNLAVANSYVYIPGTDIAKKIQAQSGFVVIDSVPAGTIPKVNYAKMGDTGSITLRFAVHVLPEDTVVFNPAWNHSCRISFNTGALGANVPGSVENFPVLIRLNANNFNFTQAQSNRGELRFTQSDNSALFYEIERFDPVAQIAEIWVKLDTVFGNDTAQSIWMFWGAQAAQAGSATVASNGPMVFDTAKGFQGVWHLQEPGNASAFDATGNHYDGTPYGMTAADTVNGAVGIAKHFNGTSGFIRMFGTANSKLNFPQGGVYSISAWVSVEAPATLPELIIGKGHSQYYLRYNYYSATSFWEFVEYHDPEKQIHITETPAAPVFSWKFLTSVRDGNKQRLFLNGEEVANDSIRLYPFNGGITARDTMFDVAIGRHLQTTTEGDCFFKGIIDEVRILSVASSADWIRLCYMNQRFDDKLVKVINQGGN